MFITSSLQRSMRSKIGVILSVFSKSDIQTGRPGGGDDTSKRYAKNPASLRQSTQTGFVPKLPWHDMRKCSFHFFLFFFFCLANKFWRNVSTFQKSQHVNLANLWWRTKHLRCKRKSVLPVFLFLSGMCIYPACAQSAAASRRDFNLKAAKRVSIFLFFFWVVGGEKVSGNNRRERRLESWAAFNSWSDTLDGATIALSLDRFTKQTKSRVGMLNSNPVP